MPNIEQDDACQICFTSFGRMDLREKEEHYDHHFEAQPNASPSTPPANDTPSTPAKKKQAPHIPKPRGTNFSQMFKLHSKYASPNHPDPENVFWFASQDFAPPDNFTPGLMPVLKRAIIRAHEKGNTRRAVLCYEGMVHIATEGWDMGWGCGYRNFLMACTALLDQQVQPMYFPLLDAPIPPGVRNLQKWIEDAWLDGFDEEGAEQLKHRLVGTKKWIGTTEIYVAFISRGIPVRLVDFRDVKKGVESVTEWVVNYFSEGTKSMKQTVHDVLKGATPVISTGKMPLILQHQGHSRTIVGYEVNKSGAVNLLLFDPSRRPKNDIRNAALACAPSPLLEKDRNHAFSPTNLMYKVLHPHDRGGDENSEDDAHRKRRGTDLYSEDVKRVRGGLEGDNVDELFVPDEEETNPREGDSQPGSGSRTKENGKDHVNRGRSLNQSRTVNKGEGSRTTGGPRKSATVPNVGVPSGEEKLDPAKVINFFRVNPDKLKKNDRYQILYFPLEAPLDEEQRWQYRVIQSERVD